MKKLFVFLLFILLLTISLNAQQTGFGIGVGASSTIGLNLKFYIAEEYALSTFASYHSENGNLQSMTLHLDLHYQPVATLRSPAYIGFGLKGKPIHETNERYLWNLRFIAGFMINWYEDWDLSFECVPTLEVSPITSIYINGMAIFRVWF